MPESVIGSSFVVGLVASWALALAWRQSLASLSRARVCMRECGRVGRFRLGSSPAHPRPSRSYLNCPSGSRDTSTLVQVPARIHRGYPSWLASCELASSSLLLPALPMPCRPRCPVPHHTTHTTQHTYHTHHTTACGRTMHAYLIHITTPHSFKNNQSFTRTHKPHNTHTTHHTPHTHTIDPYHLYLRVDRQIKTFLACWAHNCC